jgi:hypothetical protein
LLLLLRVEVLWCQVRVALCLTVSQSVSKSVLTFSPLRCCEVDLDDVARSKNHRYTYDPTERGAKPSRGRASGGEKKDIKDILTGSVWWVVLRRTLCGTIESRYEGVSKSLRTGRLERELQMVKLYGTRYSCIDIL